MRITIIGTGYVGLITGVCLAEMGNQVICLDIDDDKIEKLNGGNINIYEPGLKIIYSRNRKERRLHFTSDLSDAIIKTDIVFLALPTPSMEDGSADISSVLAVSSNMAKLFSEEKKNNNFTYKIVVNKSTVPVGTSDRIKHIFEKSGLEVGEDFDVASNPEFLREGYAVEDFMKPDRIVIGVSSPKAEKILKEIYNPFVRSGNPIIVMDEKSAEMTKYASNSYLAARITFINEIANLCDQIGANVDHVRYGMGTDSRIGTQFLYPGIGFGGSCFPKDVRALSSMAKKSGYNFQMLNSILDVNQLQRTRIIKRMKDYFGKSLEDIRFAVWGLAFKANTNDVRESPSHYLIKELISEGASIIAFDPEAIETSKQELGTSIEYAEDQYAALESADALVIATEWNEFRRPDFKRMKKLMKNPLIFDGRNLYEPNIISKYGFEYFSVGRP